MMDAKDLLKSDAFFAVRMSFIRRIRKLAMDNGRCQEKDHGKCTYPHCSCLHGVNGPIDPVTGKEEKYQREGHGKRK